MGVFSYPHFIVDSERSFTYTILMVKSDQISKSKQYKIYVTRTIPKNVREGD